MELTGHEDFNETISFMKCDYDLRIEAEEEFERFLQRVRKGKVRNDGSDALLSAIDEFAEDERTWLILDEGKVLYRARLVDLSRLEPDCGIEVDSHHRTKGFDETNSREPPLGRSSAGRSNIAGATHLYLASNPQTACAEVRPIVGQLISLAEFRILRPLRLVDFSRTKAFTHDESMRDGVGLNRLFALMDSQYNTPVADEGEYTATQILTDHVRKTGADGVAYRSSCDEEGVNYTIFNSCARNVGYLGSTLYMLRGESKTFLDFNGEKLVESHTNDEGEYSEAEARSGLDALRRRLERTKEGPECDNGSCCTSGKGGAT